MGARAAAGFGAGILVSEWSFACAACGSPAVTWPADPTAEAAIACGGCARPLGTLAAFRAGIEGILAARQPLRVDPESGRQEAIQETIQETIEEGRRADFVRSAPSS